MDNKSSRHEIRDLEISFKVIIRYDEEKEC